MGKFFKCINSHISPNSDTMKSTTIILFVLIIGLANSCIPELPECPCGRWHISPGGFPICTCILDKNSKSSNVISKEELPDAILRQEHPKCIKCSLEEINFCKNECLDISSNNIHDIQHAFCHYNCFINLCSNSITG